MRTGIDVANPCIHYVKFNVKYKNGLWYCPGNMHIYFWDNQFNQSWWTLNFIKILKTSRKHFFDEFSLFVVRFFDFWKKKERKKKTNFNRQFRNIFQVSQKQWTSGKIIFSIWGIACSFEKEGAEFNVINTCKMLFTSRDFLNDIYCSKEQR